MEGVSLTRDAIASICNGTGTAENTKPIVQVVDLRLLQTAQNSNERYRMSLSDGIHAQQAMLATQMNVIVKSGALQKGSVVQLNEFICNLIQNRKIIIVLSLDIIVEKCNTIGEPKIYDGGPARSPLPAQPSSGDQSGIAAGNQQSHGSALASGPVAGQSMTGGAYLNPKAESITNTSLYGGSSANQPISGRNATNGVPLHTKMDIDTRNHGDNISLNQRFSTTGLGGGVHPPVGAYGRPAQPPYQQSLPKTFMNIINRGPISKNEAPARIVPIAALNPYQGRWTIKARVTSKQELRIYNNQKGSGKVFSFDLLDSDGGEIRATCFNMVADQFYDQIEVGKVYLISKGSLKPADKNFNHLNNDYEMTLDSTSTIEPCSGEDNAIPRQQFNFRPINEIEGIESNSMVDVIGIISSISPSGTILRKNGTETLKRTLHLKDMSGRSIELTLWGKFCSAEGQQLQEMCDSGVFPVLAVKAGRVSDFSGRSIGTISTSQLFIEPDFPEALRLKEWYNREGKNSVAISISREMSTMGRADARKNVSQIKDEGLGRSEKPDWIAVRATVTFIKVDNFCYTACPLMVGDRPCNKKVNNNGDGTWRCERCDQGFRDCDYRYLLQLQIQDHTGLTWVTAFQECGEEIMGIPAKDLYLLKYEEQDDVKFAEIVRGVLFNEFLFKLKVKEETFSDEQRVKSTVVKAEKVNPSSESGYIMGLIDKLLGEESSGVFGRSGNISLDSGISNAGYGSVGQYGTSLGSNITADRYKVEAPSQVGQYGNEYGSFSSHNMGTRAPMQISCNSCGAANHSAQNCPRIMNSPRQPLVGGGYVNRPSRSAFDGASASGDCFKCHQPGHWARDCPGLNAVPPVYGNTGVPGRHGYA